MTWNKILIIGDMHMKPSRGYADVIADRREPEEQAVLDFIVEQSKDCDKVVFMGDELNSKNNPSEVVRKFTAFLERFETQQVYIVLGNHNKSSDGTTALDYLKEIKNKKWNIISKEVTQIENMLFVPYFTKAELECDNYEQTTKKVMAEINKSDAEIMFAHLSISGSETNSGALTDLFDEIVLPRDKIRKKFKQVFAGHIHQPQQKDNVVITGSIFNDEVGELHKYLWKIDSEFKVEQIPLPGRSIYKLTDPSFEELVMIPPQNTIVKAVFTQKISDEKMEQIKEQLRKFDAYSLMEQYPKERRKLVDIEAGKSVLDLDMTDLLKIYAKQNSKDENMLLRGWQLIQSL